MTDPAALRLDGVSLAFGGRPALDGLSLTLAAGEVYALLGPNGADKTTTINLILGFLAPDAGSIVDRPQQDASPLQRAGMADPAALILTFAPLAIFVLAFAAVAKKRERGTLRLALGAATRPDRIVVAKLLAVVGSGVAALVVPVTIAMVGVAVFHGALDGDATLRLLSWAIVMSPLGLTQALATLAGTDGARHRAFEAQVRTYQLGLRRSLYPLVQCEAVDPARRGASRGKYSLSDPDVIPAFAMTDASSGHRSAAVLPFVAWLLVAGLILGGLGLRRADRWAL